MAWDPQWMKKVPLLALLDGDAQVALAREGRYAQYAREQFLYREGDKSSTGVAFVYCGRVQHGYVSDQGDRELVIELVGASGMLGLEDAYIGMDRRNTAKAMERTSVFWVPADVIRRFIDRNPTLQQFMLNSAIRNAISIERRLAEKVFNSVRHRLAMYLFESVENLPDDEKVVRLTQEQIAFQIGTVRECVARLMSELREIEAVRWKGESLQSGLEIVDPMMLYDWGLEE